jgi:hypothetical protein
MSRRRRLSLRQGLPRGIVEVKRVKTAFKNALGLQPKMRIEFRADGLGVKGKNLAFLSEPRFVAAWENARLMNAEAWNNAVPDIRWRAHTCCWAATQAMCLEGDFVECGVHGGILSLTVAGYLGFASSDRQFWLFDTFAGIPIDQLASEDRPYAEALNCDHHQIDIFDIATRNFAPFPNAHLIRGLLPDTITDTPVQKIAYLSMDLNNAPAELMSIEMLWPKLVTGAIIVIDDYGFKNHESQYSMWNEFAYSHGVRVLTLPTGQGLMIKPA